MACCLMTRSHYMHQHWLIVSTILKHINTSRPRQIGRHFPDNIFKCISWMKIYTFRLRFQWIKFVPQGPINNIPGLVQIMAWRLTGDKPLSETILALVGDAYMRHSASMSWFISPWEICMIVIYHFLAKFLFLLLLLFIKSYFSHFLLCLSLL